MDKNFEKNLLSTKEAGELSGYHSDYLARLARAGKIAGKKVGHSWFVDKESLSTFLSQQTVRKTEYARSLANARAEEYAVHQAPVSPLSLATTSVSFGKSIFALGVASFILVGSAVGLRSLNEEIFDSLIHTSQAAALLSAPEQLALGTYNTLNPFFSSAARTIASLFSPSPALVVVPSSPISNSQLSIINYQSIFKSNHHTTVHNFQSISNFQFKINSSHSHATCSCARRI